MKQTLLATILWVSFLWVSFLWVSFLINCARTYVRRNFLGYVDQLEQQNQMGWPTTGPTGGGNAATGQHIANGTGTTLLWGTNNFANITGWLTITKVNQKTIMAYDENLPNGDGLTAGKVQGIDGSRWELDVRDDVNQVTNALTVGQRLVIQDGAGLVPGGARGSQYSCIIADHSWEAAPKMPAGRTLSVEKFLLIA
jgi:hypothetical protein